MKKKIKELENKAREIAKMVFKDHHGKAKAEIWCCGYIKLSTSRKTKCKKCGKECYYDTKLRDKFKKNAKKLCPKCVLKYHSDDLFEFEKEIIKSSLKDN